MRAQPPGSSASISRRQLLRLAGGAGLAAAATACSAQDAEQHRPPGRRTSELRTAEPPGRELPPSRTAQATPAESPLTPANVASAVLVCRDAWGARSARTGGRRHTITRMTLHHSAVPLADNRIIADRLRQHQRYHHDQHGWIDIAYHIGIDRDGNIFELRTPEVAGDTATDYDPAGHFLVLCEGDFDRETVPDV